jgi:hypothetical protein
LTSTVASLSLQGKSEGEGNFPINVEIGRPYQIGEDEWACPVSVRPLYDHLHDQHGGDSFQALFLAMRLALSLLKNFTEKGGSLLMDGEETAFEADGGFPFEAYTVGYEME